MGVEMVCNIERRAQNRGIGGVEDTRENDRAVPIVVLQERTERERCRRPSVGWLLQQEIDTHANSRGMPRGKRDLEAKLLLSE